MARLLVLIVGVLTAVSTINAHAQSPVTNAGPLVGTWRLISLEQLEADGQVHRVDCSGLLILTVDGHMAVQVMESHPKPSASQYSQNGYEATFGTFKVASTPHRFVFHVDAALVPSLRRKDLPRAYEVHNN